jgi:hypothetical protein
MTTIELPEEIWLGIMSYLDYFALKNCMRVSKTFRSYTELRACQEKMFRSSSKAVLPKGEPIDLDDVVLHPAFDKVSYECASELDGVCFLIHLADKEVPILLTDTSAADEYATDPPVAFMRLQITNWTPIQLKNKTGITVEEVMKSLCHFFSRDRCLKSRGDHTVWTGWNERKLDYHGNLWLRAIRFESVSMRSRISYPKWKLIIERCMVDKVKVLERLESEFSRVIVPELLASYIHPDRSISCFKT